MLLHVFAAVSLLCLNCSIVLRPFIICAQDLRRKLPVTRTLFPWHNTLAFSLTRDLAKELALGKWSLCRPCHRMASSGIFISMPIHAMCFSVVTSNLHCLIFELSNSIVNREHTFVDYRKYTFTSYPPALPDVNFCSFTHVSIRCFSSNSLLWSIIICVITYEAKKGNIQENVRDKQNLYLIKDWSLSS